MKKILLIIAITFCIFQMVVLADLIDIGSSAENRTGTLNAVNTVINLVNPANVSGAITKVQIYCDSNLADCEVATFFLVSGTNYSTRDSVYIGTVTSGGTRTFDVDLDVEVGDYIGIRTSSGSLDRSPSGGSIRSGTGDYIPCTNVEFPYSYDYIISLYGTGVMIDIGNLAINRNSAAGVQTSVATINPANASGKITSVEIYPSVTLSNCEVATFYVVSGNYLSTRDTHAIGTVTGGEKGIFSGLDITVKEGDYIGIYYTAGQLERTTGSGGLFLAADGIPCTNVLFTESVAWSHISCYGTGETPPFPLVKWGNVVITKWNAKEITKWNAKE